MGAGEKGAKWRKGVIDGVINGSRLLNTCGKLASNRPLEGRAGREIPSFLVLVLFLSTHLPLRRAIGVIVCASALISPSIRRSVRVVGFRQAKMYIFFFPIINTDHFPVYLKRQMQMLKCISFSFRSSTPIIFLFASSGRCRC